MGGPRQFGVGELVRITSKPDGGATFEVGNVVRVKTIPPAGGGMYRCEYLDGRDWWYVKESEMEAYVEGKAEDSGPALPPEAIIGQVDGGPEARKAAFEWAELHIPEADTEEIVKLANWLMTGEFR